MGRTYFYWKCQDRHEAPSGRNCPAHSPFEEDSDEEIEFHTKNQPSKEDARTAAGSTGQQTSVQEERVSASEVKTLSSRLDNLEELLYKLTDNFSKDPTVTEKLSKSTSPVFLNSSSPVAGGGLLDDTATVETAHLQVSLNILIML